MTFNPSLQTILGSILVAVITGFATYLVARTGAKSTRESAEVASAVSWASDLTKRIESLEDDVAKMREELSIQQRLTRSFAVFVDRIGLWLERGDKEHRPIPPAAIHQYIDTGLWGIEEHDDREH